MVILGSFVVPSSNGEGMNTDIWTEQCHEHGRFKYEQGHTFRVSVFIYHVGLNKDTPGFWRHILYCGLGKVRYSTCLSLFISTINVLVQSNIIYEHRHPCRLRPLSTPSVTKGTLKVTPECPVLTSVYPQSDPRVPPE